MIRLPVKSLVVLAAAAAALPAGIGAPPASAAPAKAKAPAARAAPARSKSLAPRSTNWNGAVAATANGSMRLGNPDAPVQLVEYVSYTCSHCAAYQKESDPVLRLTVIPKGQVSIVVTNFLRNPVDATVALLTQCGDPKRFFVRHNAFFATQKTWMGKLAATSRSQQERWYQGRQVDQFRAIASDLGFYKTMEGWGVDRVQADACLANQAMIDKLKAQQAEVRTLGLEGTPSFTLNGDTLEAHDWPTVSKAITAKLAEQRAGNI